MMKRAIILAGGKGTRLKPYSVAIPKPLVPVGEKPILEGIIGQLKRSGFTHITITVNHMADIIMAFFGDGSKWGVKIDYTIETKPLSTMGPLTLVKDLPNNFLVMNGDVLTDLNYSEFFDLHLESKAIFTVGAHRRSDVIDYGLLHQNEHGELVHFEEKPTYDFLVSMGIYMVNSDVLEYIPPDTFFGFDHLMLELISAKKLPKIFEYAGFWLDIGRPSDYEIAVNKIHELNI
jgi:NDP-sugar pyrophosphorylase family protein